METIERIRQSYLRAMDGYEPENSEIWGHITATKQADIHEALVRGGEPLRAMLSDPASTNLYYGVDMICADARASTPVAPQDWQIAWHGEKISELLGVIGADRLPNPEGGLAYVAASQPARQMEELLGLLDAAFPTPVDFPNPFRGEVHAARTSRGYVSHRSIYALYQTYRLLQSTPCGTARCLEIGGGLGRTAYHATRAGVPAYTIVDLPMMSVGQACFLMATLGPDNVSLYGEGDLKAPVRLRPPHWLFSAGEEFDVALNCDSLVEMSRGYAERYIAFIRANCRGFISINHEANRFTVRELWPGLMRFPYAMRPGYVEEFTTPLG